MKAGTTWLHGYLAASPQCQPGHRKEYHVFDSLDFPVEQGKEPWLLHRVVDKARASLDDVAQGRPTDPTFLHQAAMIADEQLYFDYFTALFSRVPATGSPSTSRRATRCSRQTDWPRSAPSSNGGPCGRCRCSSCATRSSGSGPRCGCRSGGGRRTTRARRGARRPAVRRAVVRRADPLRETVPHLDAAFGDRAGIRLLRGAVRPGHLRAGAAVAVRAGRDRLPRAGPRRAVQRVPALGEPCPKKTVRAVAGHYRATYEFVASRFPDRDLPRIWPSARFVL